MYAVSNRCIGYLGIYIMALSYITIKRKPSIYRELREYAFDLSGTYGTTGITKSLPVEKISTGRQGIGGRFCQ